MKRTVALIAALCAFACSPTPPPIGSGEPAAAIASDDAGAEADAGSDADAGADFDAGSSDAGLDVDRDGLEDSYENRLARDYLPFFSMDPQDGCPLSGILFRARPHPKDPNLVFVIYDRLYQRDCGLSGHVGDDEVFSVTIDPRKPFPAGLTAMKAISHQGTACERVSTCDRCGGSACTFNSAQLPVVFASKDKHGSYVDTSTCQFSCFDSCTLAANSSVPPMQNAGEPGAPMTNNLSTNGFVTAANGWTESSLFDFDPWAAGKEFGTAGVVASDLVDPAFDTPACAAP
ncbi:MAG: hypothetical protein ACJ790_03465 [Myxococcaceae bacterium]